MKQNRIRNVVISGASRGIGLAIAEAFIKQGDQVFCLSRSAPQSRAIQHLQCDISQEKEVSQAIEDIATKVSTLDVVIANSGMAGSDDENDDLDFWHRMIDINLNGTHYLLRKAIPHIPHGGTVITIGSVLSLFGVEDQLSYTAVKHGILGYTRALSKRLAHRHITANCICPGWTDTDMAQERAQELQKPLDELVKAVPMGRAVIPDEIGDLSVFLAGPGARMITGQALCIDGGVTA